MQSINVVVLMGYLDHAPVRRDHPSGKPWCTATLRLEEHRHNGDIWPSYVPRDAYGAWAEQLAACPAGTLLSLQGALTWRAANEAAGIAKGTVSVFVKHLQVLWREETPPA